MTAHVATEPSGLIWLEYMVDCATDVLLPEWDPGGRKDGLWNTTCFELFIRARSDGTYQEFNFASSGQWAAYAFDGYRESMRDLPIDIEFTFEATESGSCYWLSIDPIVPDYFKSPFDIALSAVIEEKDGTKSYWALRHPPGAPDFHHPDCFAVTLEAPDPA